MAVEPTPYNRDPKYFFKETETERRKHALRDIFAPRVLLSVFAFTIVASVITSYVFVAHVVPGLLPAIIGGIKTPAVSIAEEKTVADDVLPSLFTISLAPNAAGCELRANRYAGLIEDGVENAECGFEDQDFISHGVLVSSDGHICTPTTRKLLSAYANNAPVFAWDQHGKNYPVSIEITGDAISIVRVIMPLLPSVVDRNQADLKAGATYTILERGAFDFDLPSKFNTPYMEQYVYSGRFEKTYDRWNTLYPTAHVYWRSGSVVVTDTGAIVGFVSKNGAVIAPENWDEVLQELIVE